MKATLTILISIVLLGLANAQTIDRTEANLFIINNEGGAVKLTGRTTGTQTAPWVEFLDATGTKFSVSAGGNTPTPLFTLSPTNVINMEFATSFLELAGNLTLIHVTNGAAGVRMEQDVYLRAGGANRTLTIPATWTTNRNSAVPPNITNGWTTVMKVQTIGLTSATGQTNVLVSFDYFKNQ